MPDNLIRFLSGHELLQRCGLSEEEIIQLSAEVEKRFLADYLGGIVLGIEQVMNISPALEWRDILETGARVIVKALGGDAGSIRLFDPATGALVSFGSYQFQEESRKRSIPVENSIAGMVMRSGKSYMVSDLLSEPRYQDKLLVERLGLNSMIAVPLKIPRSVETEQEIRGAVQVYYRGKNRRFDPLEVTHAEVLARRISHVVARKEILDLYELNVRKEKLVEKIFQKLSRREGIKMNQLFAAMIPELSEIIAVSSCALFSMGEEGKEAWLEICHPVDDPFIEEGHTFVLAQHPYLRSLLGEENGTTDPRKRERGIPYVLIQDPVHHALSGPTLAAYAERRGVDSVLLVPLESRGVLRYFMMFCSGERYAEFSRWEIELLAFFGKEVIQALRMERLDDILHDLKNPAVAIGGFARRARRLLDAEDPASVREKLVQALDIVVEETERIQGLSTSVSIEGRERYVDVGQTLKRRFRLNAEAIRARGLKEVRVSLEDVETGLLVLCPPFELERVLDNLLMNASEAIPPEGGHLKARCVREGESVCISVRNNGILSDEQLKKARSGEVRGRGFGIAQRFVQTLGGTLQIVSKEIDTEVSVHLPLASPN